MVGGERSGCGGATGPSLGLSLLYIYRFRFVSNAIPLSVKARLKNGRILFISSCSTGDISGDFFSLIRLLKRERFERMMFMRSCIYIGEAIVEFIISS